MCTLVLYICIVCISRYMCVYMCICVRIHVYMCVYIFGFHGLRVYVYVCIHVGFHGLRVCVYTCRLSWPSCMCICVYTCRLSWPSCYVLCVFSMAPLRVGGWSYCSHGVCTHPENTNTPCIDTGNPVNTVYVFRPIGPHQRCVDTRLEPRYYRMGVTYSTTLAARSAHQCRFGTVSVLCVRVCMSSCYSWGVASAYTWFPYTWFLFVYNFYTCIYSGFRLVTSLHLSKGCRLVSSS